MSGESIEAVVSAQESLSHLEEVVDLQSWSALCEVAQTNKLHNSEHVATHLKKLEGCLHSHQAEINKAIATLADARSESLGWSSR